MINKHLNEKSKFSTEDVLERSNKVTRISEENSDPSRYGTDYIVRYKDFPLTVENILKMSMEEREDVAEFLFFYFRENGFPFPSYSQEELITDFEKLCTFNSSSIVSKENNIDILSCGSTVGNTIFKHFNHHFFNVKDKTSKSMVDVFNNDELLMKIIRNRLGITFFYRGESYPFTISGNMIKQGARSMRLTTQATNFRPSVAKYIFETFTPTNGIIYDYSNGFNQRLLAAMSSSKNFTYYSADPWKETVEAGNKIRKYFNFEDRSTITEIGSENYCPEDLIGKVDLAFSSPPYFNTEIYSNDTIQAYYYGYDYFINTYWTKTVENIHKLLKPKGVFGINISEKYKKYNLRKDMCNVIESVGFQQKQTMYMRYAKSHLSKKVGTNNLSKLEGIYFFEKQ